MKKLLVITLITVISSISISSCSKNEETIDVKRDFEYYYSVYEKCFLMLDDGIKKRKINRSLDSIEKYVKQEEREIELVGKRLNSIILTEQESLHLIKFGENYSTLTAKYLSYFEANLNPTQKDRFVTMVVEGIGKKMMDQLMMPKSSTVFLRKLFGSTMGGSGV